MIKKTLLSIWLAAVFVFFLFATSQAATVTFDSYEKFSGTPQLPTFSATITDITGGVSITMAHPISTDADIVFTWFFNIVPPITASVTASNVAFVSGVEATGQGPTPGVQLAEDVQQADGDGKFDLVFTWPNSGAGEFIEGGNSVYTVAGLTAVQFLDLSTPVGGQGPYYSAVEQSAWWGQEDMPTVIPPPPIPEPTTMLLLGLGLMGLAGVGRKFSKG